MGVSMLVLLLQSIAANNWDKTTAVATAVYAGAAIVAAVAAIVAGIIIWRQWQAADRTRRFGVLNHVYEQFHTDQAKADRFAIYTSQLKDFGATDCERLWRRRKWRGVRLQSVERTADIMHYIGLLEHKGLIGADDLFDYFMWPALRVYRDMRWYLRWVREHRNPRYAEHFIGLVPKLESRFKKEYGPDVFRRRLGVDTLDGLPTASRRASPPNA